MQKGMVESEDSIAGMINVSATFSLLSPETGGNWCLTPICRACSKMSGRNWFIDVRHFDYY